MSRQSCSAGSSSRPWHSISIPGGFTRSSALPDILSSPAPAYLVLVASGLSRLPAWARYPVAAGLAVVSLLALPPAVYDPELKSDWRGFSLALAEQSLSRSSKQAPRHRRVECAGAERRSRDRPLLSAGRLRRHRVSRSPGRKRKHPSGHGECRVLCNELAKLEQSSSAGTNRSNPIPHASALSRPERLPGHSLNFTEARRL